MNAAKDGGMPGLVWELGGDVLRFPMWWYSEGLRDAFFGVLKVVRGYAIRLGVFVWAKNILTPMFGRYDWQSRIISVFMRIANVIIRGFAVFVVALVGVLTFFLYLILPIVAVIFVSFHASSFFGL